jgi:hypothetical protein
MPSGDAAQARGVALQDANRIRAAGAAAGAQVGKGGGGGGSPGRARQTAAGRGCPGRGGRRLLP